jgi:hypothetical protein
MHRRKERRRTLHFAQMSTALTGLLTLDEGGGGKGVADSQENVSYYNMSQHDSGRREEVVVVVVMTIYVGESERKQRGEKN